MHASPQDTQHVPATNGDTSAIPQNNELPLHGRLAVTEGMLIALKACEELFEPVMHESFYGAW